MKDFLAFLRRTSSNFPDFRDIIDLWWFPGRQVLFRLLDLEQLFATFGRLEILTHEWQSLWTETLPDPDRIETAADDVYFSIYNMSKFPDVFGPENRRFLPDSPNGVHIIDGPDERYLIVAEKKINILLSILNLHYQKIDNFSFRRKNIFFLQINFYLIFHKKCSF